MRAYTVTSSGSAREILKTGFRAGKNTYFESSDRKSPGVWFVDRAPDLEAVLENNATTLSIDLPEEVFARYEECQLPPWREEQIPPDSEALDQIRAGRERCDEAAYQRALLPEEVANSFGQPSVHDHQYARWSRKRLVEVAESYDREAHPEPYDADIVADLWEAIRFLDEVGRQNVTVLRQEQNGEES